MERSTSKLSQQKGIEGLDFGGHYFFHFLQNRAHDLNIEMDHKRVQVPFQIKIKNKKGTILFYFS